MEPVSKNDLTPVGGRPRIKDVEASALGKRFAAARAEKGLSLNQLSTLCGELTQTINAIERGASRSPSIERALSIGHALGMTDEEIAALYNEEFAAQANKVSSSILSAK